MKWSKTHIFTLREAPQDAELISHKLLMRGGYIKKIAPGIFVYQDLALRVIRRVEGYIRKVLTEKYGLTEILMPMVQPKELWQETNRWSEVKELLRFKNRNDQDFCLGGTHEEVVTDVVRNDVRSYRDLPKFLYQIQTKYRDEIRPRYGLMRAREFIMKDAYSFDVDQQSALVSYDKMYAAYKDIFESFGLDYRIVQADAGNIGGSQTHEFQVLAEAGEDQLLVAGDLAFNVEIAKVAFDPASVKKENPLPVEEFATPGLKTIEDLSRTLKVPSEDLVKTLFVKDEEGKQYAVCLRGSDELNLIKLKNAIGCSNPPEFLNDEEVKKLTGAYPGSCGPQGLKVPVYVDQFLTNKMNYIVGANKDGFHVKNICPDRDFKIAKTADIRLAKDGDTAPNGQKYKAYKGIEVGHIFYLGTKYSEAMKANYLDKNGKNQPIEMGCYGIGVTRTLQSAIEQNHDENGIIWPKELAPYHVHICLLDPADAELAQFTNEIESILSKQNIDVLVDDRDERPGIKFKDADLLGMPFRLVIGRKSFDNKKVELVTRKGNQKSELENNVQVVVEKLLQLLK